LGDTRDLSLGTLEYENIVALESAVMNITEPPLSVPPGSGVQEISRDALLPPSAPAEVVFVQPVAVPASPALAPAQAHLEFLPSPMVGRIRDTTRPIAKLPLLPISGPVTPARLTPTMEVYTLDEFERLIFTLDDLESLWEQEAAALEEPALMLESSVLTTARVPSPRRLAQSPVYSRPPLIPKASPTSRTGGNSPNVQRAHSLLMRSAAAEWRGGDILRELAARPSLISPPPTKKMVEEREQRPLFQRASSVSASAAKRAWHVSAPHTAHGPSRRSASVTVRGGADRISRRRASIEPSLAMQRERATAALAPTAR
jgi:hypothetical protein